MLTNLTDKTNELIANLRQAGFKGLPFPEVQPECRQDWSEHYAVVENVYWDDFVVNLPAGVDGYFAWDQYEYDFLQMLKNFYSEACPGEIVTLIQSFEQVKDEDTPDGIILRYRERCHELEVYRHKGGKIVRSSNQTEE